MKPSTLLTEGEAALRLGISVSRVRQLRYGGRAPQPIQLPHRKVRYTLGDVDKARRERLALGGLQ